jgi:hypothetical protein
MLGVQDSNKDDEDTAPVLQEVHNKHRSSCEEEPAT